MKNYKKFLFEKLSENELKYMCFDWDDNILIMPTVIHVEHLINDNWVDEDVSTSKFAEIRSEITDYYEGKKSVWKRKNDNYDDTYSDFRDYGPKGENIFLEDTIKAIKTNSFGPAWDKFIECLVDSNIFMIITARGHEPKSIRKSVEWVIFKYLTDKQKKEMEINLREFNFLFDINDTLLDFDDLVINYLNLCDFIGISSQYFKNNFNPGGDAVVPEKFKALAIRYFTEKVDKFGKKINRRVKVGFSDDDETTAHHIYKYMKNDLWFDFPLDYYVYYTKDGIKRLE